MRVLACYNIKGGVGKTATAVNLAYLAAVDGARTLVWDLDPQGAASFYFRIRPKLQGAGKRLVAGRDELRQYIRGTDFDDLDLVPSDASYRRFEIALARGKHPRTLLGQLLQPLDGAYDYVFLDCAPGISLLSESVFVVADALLVPTIPTTLSLRTLEQLDVHLAQRGPRDLRLLPFFCMVDRRKLLHRAVCNGGGAGRAMLKTEIPYASVVEQMGARRAPIGAYAGRAPAAQAYRTLWNEIAVAIGNPCVAPGTTTAEQASGSAPAIELFPDPGGAGDP